MIDTTDIKRELEELTQAAWGKTQEVSLDVILLVEAKI